MKNIRENPKLEINTIDQIARRGFRFKGTGEIFKSGDVFNHVANDIWKREGRDVPIHAVVKVRVLEAYEVLPTGSRKESPSTRCVRFGPAGSATRFFRSDLPPVKQSAQNSLS